MEVILAVGVKDVLLCSANCQGRKIGGVRSHVGDKTPFIEGLGHTHCCGNRETEFSAGFLLKGGGGERRCGITLPFLLVYGRNPVFGPDDGLKESAGLRLRAEFTVQGGVDCGFGAGNAETCLNLIERLRPEGHDLFLPVYDKAQGHALYAAGRKLGLDLFPEDGRKFKAHKAVQHAAGLLCGHKVHVNVPGVLNGLKDGGLCNLMEYNAAGLFLGKLQCLRKVPGNGLSLTVFIGGEPDGGGGFRELLKFGHHLFLVCGHNILRLEAVFNVYAKFVLFQVPDVAD